MNILITEKECRNAYRDILRGRSFVKEDDLYIKHFKEEDIGNIDSIYQDYFNYAKSLGICSEKDQLEFLQKEKYWTREEEEGYITAKFAVKDAEEHRGKLAIESQIEQMDKIIEEKKGELSQVTLDREELVGVTLERYASQKVNQKYVFYSFYKDEDFKTLYYTEDEFDDLSNEELGRIVGIYNEAVSIFSEENIKRIAVNAFFLNPFFICEDDPVRFFGTNVLKLTIYQMNLFSRGKLYKSIINEGKSPPDDMYDQHNSVERLARFYENAFSMLQADRKRMEAQARVSHNKNEMRRGR